MSEKKVIVCDVCSKPLVIRVSPRIEGGAYYRHEGMSGSDADGIRSHICDACFGVVMGAMNAEIVTPLAILMETEISVAMSSQDVLDWSKKEYLVFGGDR